MKPSGPSAVRARTAADAAMPIIVDEAFAGCRNEERAFRAALASHYAPAIIDDAIATVRAQTSPKPPGLLAPPHP